MICYSSKGSATTCPKAVTTDVSTNLPITFVDTQLESSPHNQLILMQKPSQSDLEALTIICKQPSFSIEEEVVNVYFRNFARLYRTQDTVRGFLPYLAPMYANSPKGSLLRTATHAAALCAISQLPNQKPLQYRAADTYGKAMRIAAEALQDPVQATSDETLQATLLLCLYEVSISSVMIQKIPLLTILTVYKGHGSFHRCMVKSRRRCERDCSKQRNETTRN